MTPGSAHSVCLHPFDCNVIVGGRAIEGVLDNGVQICDTGVGEFLLPVALQTAAHRLRKPCEAPWGSYLIADARSGQIVGVCAFVDAPNNGEVEIAYYTFPPYEGRGYATLAASAITALAMKSPLVRTVIAHTLMETNASTRILTRCGFVQTGQAIDPDEGTVWRWEKPRPKLPAQSG